MKSLKSLMDLNGRFALITGGAGHIGNAACDALAELGAGIAILDVNPDATAQTAKRVSEMYGVKAVSMVVDLADYDSIKQIPNRVRKHFGGLDIIINNAALGGTAVLQGWASPFLEQDVNTWQLGLDVNLTAVFFLVQLCTGLLNDSGHGSIINISSIYGMLGPDLSLYDGTEMGNPAAYAASKGGMIQLTRWLATTLAPSIRVNTISPGGVFRNQPTSFRERYCQRTPLKRMASEEDLKGAIAYLASDLSAYVTGHNLVVDGGWTIW